MSGNVSLKENPRRCLGLVLFLSLLFVVVLGMYEDWEEVQRKNLRSLFNSSTWTTSLWKITIVPLLLLPRYDMMGVSMETLIRSNL